ncbi:MAG: hypothetical protein K2X49_08350 [Acetobacteraceae bacterium]|nr:hypothetical protein [Acetobacteraceae bacterium]
MDVRLERLNPKRRLLSRQEAARQDERLRALAEQVRYGGNPEHKRDPGDFGLTPPAAWRRGKSLCDDAGVTRREDARALLAAGLLRGLVDARWDGSEWPGLIWAVTDAGTPLEAQREAPGRYHGYPMPAADPLRDTVLARWHAIA